MGALPDAGDAAVSARLESTAAELADFRPRVPHDRPDLLGGEAGIPLERILAGLARGREALDLAVGEGLCALEDRDALMDLGFSRMADYARERLGLPATTARDRVRLARGLATRPLLREAVRSGRLSPRKALEVMPVARGDGERAWLLAAGALSVRELRAAVARILRRPPAGEACGAAPPGEASGGAPVPGEASAAAPAPGEERWEVLSLPLRPEDRAVVEEAMRLAGELLGRGAPAWQRLEAIAQEFLGWEGAEPGEEELEAPPRGGIPPGDLEKAAEIMSNGWDWLEAVEPVAAPELREMEPAALDARLRDLMGKRARWDELFGALARAFVQRRMATALGFADLGQYVAERLGMSRRAFEQRVWLERRMEELPRLRDARERGELSYEKARLVAGVADAASLNGWIRRAGETSCADLERAIAAAEDAQACARQTFEARLPERVAGLLFAALRAAAEAAGEPLDPGGCLVRLARHFVEAWGPLLERRRTPSRRVQERDGGWCQAPGCSRPSAHGHHVVLRSRGGGNGPENQVSLCAPHHLRGVHGGRLRVSGTAPGELVWQLCAGAREAAFTA